MTNGAVYDDGKGKTEMLNFAAGWNNTCGVAHARGGGGFSVEKYWLVDF